MSIRAVIFDVYSTLLEVGPGPKDAESLWCEHWGKVLQGIPPVSLAEFNGKSERLIGRVKAAAKSRGIAYPEIFWPYITKTLLPELGRLTEEELGNWIYEHARLQYSTRLVPGAASLLSKINGSKMLGICANCQPHTLRELEHALSEIGLSMGLFQPQLRFYSFAAGFSKPDPAAFTWLEGALNCLGVLPGETLMVGCDMAQDIKPARSRGWRTWHLCPEAASESAGGWGQLEQLFKLSR